MHSASILVVEDDRDLHRLVATYLRKEGYAVDGAYTGQEALVRARSGSYHLVVLDLMLPDIDGFAVLRDIREASTVPYPRPRWKFYLGKWLILIPLIFLVFALGYLYTVGAGFALRHEPLVAKTLWVYAQAFGIMAVCNVALIPLALVAALIGKSLIPAVALGIGAVVVSVQILNSDFLTFFPWTAGMALVIAFVDPKSVSFSAFHAAATLFLSFVVPFVVGLYIFNKMDVHGGS